MKKLTTLNLHIEAYQVLTYKTQAVQNLQIYTLVKISKNIHRFTHTVE